MVVAAQVLASFTVVSTLAYVSSDGGRWCR